MWVCLIKDGGYFRGMNRDNSVGITTGYRLDDREVEFGVLVGSTILSSPFHRDRIWIQQTSSIMGTGGSIPGVKRLRREADHSPTTGPEVKKICIHTSTPSYIFEA
jgi:hypothetical protein